MSDLVPAAEWAAAFVAAQAEMPDIPKDKTAKIPTKSGREYSYSYADLASIIEKTRPVLAKHKLAAVQSINSDAQWVSVYTRIYHEAGHVEAFGPLNLAAGSNAQESGSAITYARRYALCAALGIAPDDDDDATNLSGADVEQAGVSPEGGAPASPPNSAGPSVVAGGEVQQTSGSQQANLGGDAGAGSVVPSEEALNLANVIISAVNTNRVDSVRVVQEAEHLLARNDQPPPAGGIDDKTLPELGVVILKALVRDLGLEEKAGAKT